tara:strand:- start:760 stop:1347 length:588 start_codon:yes stop_codon:yes gene_type:complete
MIQLNEAYWNKRYSENKIGWDAGSVTTPLKEYFDQLDDKSLKILIPGAGNAHEAEYLMNQGFTNVHILDISNEAIQSFFNRVPGFPCDQVLLEDFFEHSNQYDLIIEQTFFCAINPELRKSYVRKCFDLLGSGGKLIGLLWNHEFGIEEPPYGGNESEYRNLFEPYFEIITMELAHNSIKPRAGRELFIKLKKYD